MIFGSLFIPSMRLQYFNCIDIKEVENKLKHKHTYPREDRSELFLLFISQIDPLKHDTITAFYR